MIILIPDQQLDLFRLQISFERFHNVGGISVKRLRRRVNKPGAARIGIDLNAIFMKIGIRSRKDSDFNRTSVTHPGMISVADEIISPNFQSASTTQR